MMAIGKHIVMPFDIKRALDAARCGGRGSEEGLFDALHAYSAHMASFAEMKDVVERAIKTSGARSRRNARKPSRDLTLDCRPGELEIRSEGADLTYFRPLN
jgi:hypothetical protein